MSVRRLSDVSTEDHDLVGGKAASLGELMAIGLPVPSGFVVTTDTYRTFLERTGIESSLTELLDIDPDDSDAAGDAEERARELILDTEVPPSIRTEILEAYDTLDDSSAPAVAVRSSAIAEDLPDASFAGQQETFLGVSRETLLDRVTECWASLFTARAISYRREQGFDHVGRDIAVVVQRLIDADKSGVLFTRDPSTGADETIVEAAWGLGEAVVSGAVSPDTYRLDRGSNAPAESTIAEKRIRLDRDPETGALDEREVPEERRTARVLSDAELGQLADVGGRIEEHYGTPQDIEWAFEDGQLFVLQSRPITTIDGGAPGDATSDERVASLRADGDALVATGTSSGEALVSGLGASPGTAAGRVALIDALEGFERVDEDDVIVTDVTTPDMVPAMRRAAAIVTDEGGLTSHAAIVSRELGVPAVVGTKRATEALENGQVVTVDGDRGTVSEGRGEPREPSGGEPRTGTGGDPRGPVTATDVKVNVSLPEAAERAAATGADGVGLLRLEHLVLSLDATPARFIAEHGEEAYVSELADGIRTVLDAFAPDPVRVRTLDAPTDEFRQLDGGEREPNEHNPMLGYRGIRRSIDQPDAFAGEITAIARLLDAGYDNLELMLPLVTDAADVRRARSIIEDAGVDLDARSWGVMIETPASAIRIEDIVETGIDFVSFGTNDLTQYTLAVDRNNERVADRFDDLHPAVLELIASSIDVCRERGVRTSICGEAGSKPRMARPLIEAGISSISANIDAVGRVRREVARTERRLLLDSVR